MSVLSKLGDREYVPEVEGRPAIPPTPAKEGYYSTTQVCERKPVQQGSNSPLVPTTDSVFTDNESGIKWQVTPYNDILIYFWAYQYPTKCEVAAGIMTTLHTTSTLHTRIRTIYGSSVSYIGLAWCMGGLAICTITLPSSYTVVPTRLYEDNPIYRSSWDFDDHYTCEEVNGVEEVTPI